MAITTPIPKGYFRTLPAMGNVKGVDRENRRIVGASVIQLGAVNDSRPWDVDQDTLNQVVEMGNTGNGVKARFTHPSMSDDGMGKYLGRWSNFRVDGEFVRADLQLADSAFSTPNGDLGSYILDLAEEDPESFGNSLATRLDEETMETLKTKDGRYPLRLAKLRAVDVVDEPAATRTGLFGEMDDPRAIPDLVTRFLDQHFAGAEPQIVLDRLHGYLDSYFSKKGIEMATATPTVEVQTETVYVSADGQQFATLEELTAHMAEAKPPADPKKDETFQTAMEAIAQERERTSKITAICSQAGFPDLAGKHIEAGDDIPTVQAAMLKKMCEERQPVGSEDGDPKPKDPDAAFKADYAADAALCRQMGLEPVSEEEYIASRKQSA